MAHEVDGYGGSKDLEGRLIEIVDHEPLEPSDEVLAEDPDAPAIVLSGKRGQALYSTGEGKFLVTTFDGDVVEVDEAKLREYEALSPEEGGFDVAFPASDARREDFSMELAEVLLRQHYCLVQMTSKPASREKAAQRAAERGKWVRMVPEFESAYMGRKAGGKKVAWMEGEPGFVEEPDDLDDAEAMLTQMGFAIMPMSPAFGFAAYNRTNSMLHSPAHPDEERYLISVSETEGKVVDHKEIQDHLSFAHRRKICMMYFVHGSGGKLTLHSRDGDGDIQLTCKEGQMLVFRNDLLDYSYECSEVGHLAIQSWIMREARQGEFGMDMEVVRADSTVFEDLEQMPLGPSYSTSDETVDCMSVCGRIPGQIWYPEGYWGLLSSACDGIILVPSMRWDLDMYYSEEQYPGKGYIRHFGMLDHDQMTQFDNEFFGMASEEASMTDPPARNIMEVGYECLYRACFTKERLRGLEMVTSYGYAESEFNALAMRGCLGTFEDTRYNLMCATVAGRMHYVFGMQGPCSTTETACSSSLSATALMHCWLRPSMPESTSADFRKQLKYGMVSGSNGHFDPFYTISLCGASMLTHGGRCFTFDQSADGFVRGEGCGVMFYKVSTGEDISRLAMLCGTCMNQDGRSASLTAPHGPSQQECIRHSLREASISALDIQIQELHGTGTALGDPIEVGALRATMMTHMGVVREHPLVKTSSKSNLGHTEMCAGILGIMKCVLMGMKCASAPNIHMRLLNPHIDSNAYPVYFSSEFVDQGKDQGFHGVSSFGFGGSNARGDIWGRCLSGPRNTQPGKAPWDLSCNRIFRCAELFDTRIAKPGVEPRLELENWQDFTGDYLTGNPFDAQNAFYFQSSFNGFSSMERMHYLEDKGGHVFAFTMGEAKVEQFQIVCNRFDDAVVFPAGKMADSEATVLGPGEAPEGYRWAIDGREEAQQDTVYMVIFSWDPEARQKRVTWEPTLDERALGLAASIKYRHSYSIVASMNSFRPVAMRQLKDGKPGVHELVFRIGLSGYEEFHFLRDGDKYQAIYPAKNKALTRDVPVRGPDHRGHGKYWRVVGETGEKVTVQLQVWDGDIAVTTHLEKQGSKTFKSLRGAFRRKYYVYGQWTNWGFTAMNPDPRGGKDVYRSEMKMPAAGVQSFQIVVDENTHHAFYPELEYSDQLVSPVMGPDAKGPNLCWAISADPGSVVEILLDLGASDKREVVTWKVISEG